MTEEEFLVKYEQLAHSVQSAIKFELSRDASDPKYHYKHLRTGLNCVMADHGSLGRLLVKKGLITQDEYFEATLEGMELEVQRTTENVRKNLGLGSSIRFE